MDNKFDKLDALILLAGDVLLEEDLAYAREVLDPDLVISKRTNRRILKYIRHMQKKRTYHPVLIGLRRAAVVMLVIGTVLFASAMSIDAVREQFWNAIVEWYEDYIAVLFVDETEDTLMDVEFKINEPSYLPPEVMGSIKFETKFSCSTTYYDDNNQKIIRMEQFIRPENIIKIDNNNCTISTVKINQYPGMIVEYTNEEQSYFIVWEDEKYRYNLIAYLTFQDIDELLKIASSIYEYN